MYAVGKLIYRYITKNKRRTLFLGFSIMVSAALIFFLQIFARDIGIDSEIKKDNYKGGKYSCSVYTKNEKYIEYAKDIDIVRNISYCLSTATDFNINYEKEKVQLVGFKDNIDQLLNFKLIDGRYPKDSGEIALEKWVLDNMKDTPQIGEKITLSNYKSGLKLEYTLIGVFEYVYEGNSNKQSSIAYITLDEAKNFLREYNGKKDSQMAYEFLVQTDNKVREEEVLSKLSQAGANIKCNNLIIDNMRNSEGKFFRNITNVVACIIILAAVLTLYNAFNSSIAVKTPEFGILKAVGMNDNELRTMVIGEGFVIGIVFIAIGILVGKIGYGITMNLLEYNLLKYETQSIPFKEIVITYVFCIIGIILSVYGSSRKIFHQSSIEQIRGDEYLDIINLKRYNEKEIGEEPKIFILNLAKCNIKRNEKVLRITSISIAMSIAFILAVNYLFTNFIGDKKEFYDFTIVNNEEHIENQIKEEFIEEIKNIDGIKKVSSEATLNQLVSLVGAKDKLGKNGLEYIREAYGYFKTPNLELYMQNESYYLNANISERDMESIETLKQIVDEGKIDNEKIQEEPTCVLVQNYNKDNVTKFKVGDKIKIASKMPITSKGDSSAPGEIELTISAILDEEKYASINPNFHVIKQVNMVVIVSDKVGEKYLKNNGYSKRYVKKEVNIELENENYLDDVTSKLNDIVGKDRKMNIITRRDSTAKEDIRIINTAMLLYSLLAALGICSILNLFSVMSMNIILRKKEFAMLRAVGMSNKEIKKLIATESLLYGIKGLKLGVGIGSIFVLMLYLYMSSHIQMICIYPFKMVIILVMVTLLACICASVNSWRIVLKDDIISSIRSTE